MLITAIPDIGKFSEVYANQTLLQVSGPGIGECLGT